MNSRKDRGTQRTGEILIYDTKIRERMPETKGQNGINKNQIKVSKRRWIILLIYVLYSAANSFQWMEYSIISSIIMRFYDVTATDVDWTSIIYMAVYPVIVVPVSYLIDRKGLRIAALYGGLGTALAALIKMFSVAKGKFYLVLLGQGIGSAAQVFVLCLPSKIAAVWFDPKEISTACALAVFGTQLGFALGFVVPSFLVKNDAHLELVGKGLWNLCLVLTIYMVPVVIAILFFFPKLPKYPSSKAQVIERQRKLPSLKNYLQFFFNLFKDTGFVLHTIAYGLNVGVFAAVGTMLNQFILEYFPNSEEDSGRIGLIMVLGGMLGSLAFGMILDKSHRYKETTVFIYFAAVISVVVAMFSLQSKSKVLTYVTFGAVGVFTNAYMPVGFEFAVEITYPADESTTTGILNASTQAMGVIITLLLGKFNAQCGAFWSLASQAFLLLVGGLITVFVPNRKKRQEALKLDVSAEQESNLLEMKIAISRWWRQKQRDEGRIRSATKAKK